jgi:hypothetical protein
MCEGDSANLGDAGSTSCDGGNSIKEEPTNVEGANIRYPAPEQDGSGDSWINSVTLNKWVEEGNFVQFDTSFDIRKYTRARTPWSKDQQSKKEWTEKKRSDPKIVNPRVPNTLDELGCEVRIHI